jgi:hypothetical protein
VLIELISCFEYRITISITFSGLISVISVYFGKIFVGDILINFDYVFDFRSAFFIAVIYSVRTRVFLNILFFTVNEQKSRFKLIDDSYIISDENLSVNRIIIKIYNYIRKKIRTTKIDPHLIIIIIKLRKTRTLQIFK